MKQYLVFKFSKEYGDYSGLEPVPGIFNRPKAEEAVLQLKNEDPDSLFFIQEVGAA